MKIVLLQRALPVYRESVFEALREQARQAGHSFELWVSPASGDVARRGTEGHLPWMRSLACITLPPWLGGVTYQKLPWREVLAADVVIVPDVARGISNIMVLLLRRFLRRSVLVWGHGVNFQPDGLGRLFRLPRLRILRLADRQLVYTQISVRNLQAAGFDRDHIKVTDNAIDKTQAAGLHAKHPEVMAFRSTHGLGDAPCVVFLGSWYAGKRPEVVVQVGLALRQLVPLARVLVIGGGDGLAMLVAQAKKLPWLTLLGPLHGREKFVALAAARCLVVSGVAGLNLLDAMAVSLPVIMPRRADHSPEVAYVLDDINGLMVPDETAGLAQACSRLIEDSRLHARLSEGARQTSARYTVQAMASNILRYAVDMCKTGPVVFVYQHMLPYHLVRFSAVSEALRRRGRDCVALEVASFDRGYGQLDDAPPSHAEAQDSMVCLFASSDYLDLKPRQVSNAVLNALHRLEPSVVFAPAPAFAEGAGALHYKVRKGGKLVLMDDAWEMTEHRSRFVRLVKQYLYGYMDGGFFPARLHGEYFSALNIPFERQRYAVDVVGPKLNCSTIVENLVTGYPEPYVLFVGRLIQRKGLDVLLRAMVGVTPSLRLVIIGDGPNRDALQTLSSELGLDSRVQWLGRCNNNVARIWMTKARALLVPSDFEQWGLVVNEGWMAPTLVLGSDTVGALKATYNNEMCWMMIPAGDVMGWQHALARLLALRPDERAVLIDQTQRLLGKYSLASHTQSALELMDLPQRARPTAPIKWLALLWNGRVRVW